MLGLVCEEIAQIMHVVKLVVVVHILLDEVG